MKKIIFCLILLVVGVTSCQKEAIKSIIENNTSVLTKEQQESLNDGLNIVKKNYQTIGFTKLYPKI